MNKHYESSAKQLLSLVGRGQHDYELFIEDWAASTGADPELLQEAVIKELARSPRVDVYRGMTGVTHDKLTSLMGVLRNKFSISDDGGWIELRREFPVNKMGWWSDKIRFALIYAVTSPPDTFSKRDRSVLTFDVMMFGDVVDPGGLGRSIAHRLREAEAIVTVRRMIYAPTIGSSAQREDALRVFSDVPFSAS